MFKQNRPPVKQNPTWEPEQILAGFPQFLDVVNDMASLLETKK